ncbi:hypothetical protein FGADI_6748 [Fusarium gaditjirri]|uniref:Teneurin-like YD-shell domain-containing protein n=1 Tax=Fusarium gaditjirri TaxID=282569 RepID=A0A8H4T729_9HYPO|nr:hypothetical protein FGADI_6748 [Fusarium gaditjirri]
MFADSDTSQYQGSQAFAHRAVGNSDNDHCYSFGTLGVFGMPTGWGLGLPHVIPGVSVTAEGRTYVIDPDCGSGNDPTTARLDFIVDSWGQKIHFKYQPGTEVIIVGPDNSQANVIFAAEGVNLLTDAAGLETAFSYSTFAGTKKVISKITHPTGLVSAFDFVNIAFIDRSGGTDYMPAVQDFRRMDQDGNIMENTTYRIGTLSGGATYTGASIDLKMGGLQDALRDGNSQTANYTYDVLKASLDQNGKTIAQSSTFFNFLHLPIYEETHIMLISPTRFLLEHMRDPGSYEPLSRATAVYDEFSNQTSLIEDTYVSATGYVTQRTTEKQFTQTEWGIEMPQLEVVRDEISGFELHTKHTLSADQKTIELSSISFVAGSNTSGQPTPWKHLQYTYDDDGRQLSKSVSWVPGLKPPEGSPQFTSTATSYAFAGKILTISSADANHDTTTLSYDVTLPAGPVVLKVMPLGQTESFEYDNLGRLVGYTDPLGKLKTIAYTVGINGNTIETTDSFGYITLTKLDALGRIIQVADNGDPTQTLKMPTRVLNTKSYDCLSRIKRQINELSLETHYLYDSLGRLLQVIDPDGNVISHAYDDSQLTVTGRINGDLRSTSQLDGLSRVIRETHYPDSGDMSATARLLTMEYTFDGSNRKIRQTASQRPLTGQNPRSAIIMDTTVEYDASSFIVLETQTGTGDGGGHDIVTRQFTPDLFGNIYTYTKSTRYTDGRILGHVGPTKLFNACNQLITLRGQLGGEEQRLYNANGWGEKLTRIDGTEILFSYDAAGQLTDIATPAETTSITYACIGRNAPLNAQHDYLYDGVGQLIQDTTTTAGATTSTSYTYDGNSNLVSVVADGSAPKTMTYNAVNQRADPGFAYDANGRLLTDGNGWQYVFDNKDRLLSAQSTAPAKESIFECHADDLLARQQNSQGSKGSATAALDIYYNTRNVINAIETSDSSGTNSSSLVSDGSQVVSSYNTSSVPSYLFTQQGSTALVLGGDTVDHLSFSSYGVPFRSSTPTTIPTPLGYRQEYSDSTTGLIYLRSRWYSPSCPAFISKDPSLDQENRYAYCTGDPVNLADPSGRSPSWMVFGISLVAGIVSGGVGFVAAGALGAGTVIASITAFTVGSAGANVASHSASAAMEGRHYDFGHALVDAATGGLGGLVTGGLIALTGGYALGLVVAGAAGGFTQGAVEEAIAGHGLHAGQLAVDAMAGGAMALAAVAVLRWSFRSWRASAGIDDDGEGAFDGVSRQRRGAFYQSGQRTRIEYINGWIIRISTLDRTGGSRISWAAMLKGFTKFCRGDWFWGDREPPPGGGGGGGGNGRGFEMQPLLSV